MTSPIEITILIPVRNEEKFIVSCIESLFAKGEEIQGVEILVLDGVSEDATVKRVNELNEKFPIEIQVVSNPKKTVPYAMNIGLRRARGEYICRLDGHCVYPEGYLKTLKQYLQDNPDVSNVGVAFETLPQGVRAKERAIASALSHPFGVGRALFRLGVTEPTPVETVPFGFFRSSLFGEVGPFDEELTRNQDDELNHRMRQKGHKIVLLPEMKIQYYARGTFSDLGRMYFQYGYFKPLALKKLGRPQTVRQFLPIGFLVGLISLAFLYGLTKNPLFGGGFLGVLFTYVTFGTIASWQILWQKRESLFIFPLVVFSFFLMHFGYALGYAKGVFHFLILGRRGRDVGISRATE